MAKTTTQLKTDIRAKINTNGVQAITGQILGDELVDMVETLEDTNSELASLDQETRDFMINAFRKSIGYNNYATYYVQSPSYYGYNVVYLVENGYKVASITSTGNAQTFYFGLGNNFPIASGKTLLTAKFKNEGFDASVLEGLIRIKQGDNIIISETFPIQIEGDYILLNKEIELSSPAEIVWFCIYQTSAGNQSVGAKLTYIDSSTYSHMSDDSLKGDIEKFIPTIDTSARRIDVYPDDTNPYQIAKLIRSITDASESNRYEVYIHKGTYKEIDIITKDYVDVVGEDMMQTKLVCNGTDTATSFSDYFFSDYANTPINQIPWQYKHLMIHMSNSKVSNLTLVSQEQTKYVIHQDGLVKNFIAVVENCNIVFEWNQSMIIGIGAAAGENFVYKNCRFIQPTSVDVVNKSAFNIHNSASQNASCSVIFDKCVFNHCGYISTSDNVSGQNDWYKFIDCKHDTAINAFIYHFANGDGPYDAKLQIIGGNLSLVQHPNAMNIWGSSIVDTSRVATKASSNAVMGNAVKVDDVTNEIVIADAGDRFGIVSFLDGSNVTINQGRHCLALGSSANFGDYLYLNNGRLTTTANGDPVALFIAKPLDYMNYILVFKLA